MEVQIQQLQQATAAAIGTLELVLAGNRLKPFFPLLERGVTVMLEGETSVKSFLCDQLGLDPEFVETYVATIFLNGQPVDKIDQATLGNGDRLALSGAMPGLVGSVMRRSGLTSSFRSGISYRERERQRQTIGRAAIRVKVFNLVLAALAEPILRHGVIIGRDEWEDLLKGVGPDFWDNCRKVKLNGQEVRPQGEAPLAWPENVSWINLSLSTGNGG
jgi:hypothetical protein